MLLCYCTGDQLVVKPFQQGDPNQQWFRQGQQIRNRLDNNKVLDVASKSYWSETYYGLL